MIHQTVDLGQYAEGFETNATLDCFFLDTGDGYAVTDRPLMLIFPGGAYEVTSTGESEPVARQFMAMGYHAAVLHYSCHSRHPGVLGRLPLYEGALAMKFLRSHAAEYHICKDNIGILGFSAGGHAAGTLGTLWQSPWLREIGITAEEARPNAMILSYPVITADDRYWHKGSFVNLLGADMTAEEREFWSLEHRVTADCPPTFLWSTANDGTVPIMNTVLFSQALAAAGVPFEEHIFPDGIHGLSVATREIYPEFLPDIHRWVALAAHWLRSQFTF